jgi:hypothetical protein
MADPDGGDALTFDSLLDATRDLLVRLARVLDFDVPAGESGALARRSGAAPVPAHLSFSAVPAMLSEGLDLCERSARGGLTDRIQLADWFERVDVLSAAVETLHAAGALSLDIVHAFRSSTADGQALAHGWATWAQAASREDAGPAGP